MVLRKVPGHVPTVGDRGVVLEGDDGSGGGMACVYRKRGMVEVHDKPHDEAPEIVEDEAHDACCYS